MATHSSILAWEIPWTEEPDRVARVRHDLATKQQQQGTQIGGSQCGFDLHLPNDASELWCWRRLLRVPWTARRSVYPKGDQPGDLFGRTDAKAETPILWPSHAKC